MKLSNKFTISRILAAPFIFIIYFLPEWLGAANGSDVSVVTSIALIPILTIAELTDFFDGFYARKNSEVSDFGKMFDPFADVFLHLSMFTCFVFSGYMHPVLYVLILYREFSQNFLRMVSAKTGTAIAARKGGKVKTVFYVISCAVALFQNMFVRTGIAEFSRMNMHAFNIAGNVVFAICVLLAYISFIDYLKNFGHVLKEAAE